MFLKKRAEKLVGWAWLGGEKNKDKKEKGGLDLVGWLGEKRKKGGCFGGLVEGKIKGKWGKREKEKEKENKEEEEKKGEKKGWAWRYKEKKRKKKKEEGEKKWAEMGVGLRRRKMK